LSVETGFWTVGICFRAVGALSGNVGVLFAKVAGRFLTGVPKFRAVEVNFPRVGTRRATVDAVFAGVARRCHKTPGHCARWRGRF
jgi:hypothetical protein